MQKKWMMLVVSLIVLVFVFVACQSDDSENEGNETATTNSAENVNEEETERTLNLMRRDFFNTTEERQWLEIVAKFEDLHPDINVEFTTGNISPASGGLTTMLQSGETPPDAIAMEAGPARISVLSNVGLIQPLDEMYERNNWMEKINSVGQGLISYTDSLYEVPYVIDVFQLYYHKDRLELNNLTEPETADEFMATLQQLKDNDETPIVVGARSNPTLSWIFGQAIESIAGREKMESVLFGDGKWDDPEMVKAAETLLDWLDEGYIAEESLALSLADAKNSFFNKESIFGFYGSYQISDFVELEMEESVEVMALPSFAGQQASATGGLGTSWVVPTEAENKDLVEIWIDFYLSEDFANTVLQDPTYSFIHGSQAYMDGEPAGLMLKKVKDAVQDGIGYNPPQIIGMNALEAYFQNLQGLFAGMVTPEEVMNAIEEAAEKDREDGYDLSR